MHTAYYFKIKSAYYICNLLSEETIGLEMIGLNRVRNDQAIIYRVRNDRVRNDQVRRYRVRNDQARSDRVRSDWVTNDQVRNDRVRSDRVRSDRVTNDHLYIKFDKNIVCI